MHAILDNIERNKTIHRVTGLVRVIYSLDLVKEAAKYLELRQMLSKHWNNNG